MISQPLDATPEAERNMAKSEVVALLEEQGHEIWGEEIGRKNIPESVGRELWQLGRRLQVMAGIDAVYFMDGWEKDRGCRLEYEVCEKYGIDQFTGEKLKTLSEYIGEIAGSIFSYETFKGISDHNSSTRIKSATLIINLNNMCKPTNYRDSCASLILKFENYLD